VTKKPRTTSERRPECLCPLCYHEWHQKEREERRRKQLEERARKRAILETVADIARVEKRKQFIGSIERLLSQLDVWLLPRTLPHSLGWDFSALKKAASVVLHAAGGYPKMLNAPGITAMRMTSSSSATPRPARIRVSLATYRFASTVVGSLKFGPRSMQLPALTS
jgi:hypothetical protein